MVTVIEVLKVSLTLVYVHLLGLLSVVQADDECASAVRWKKADRSTFMYISMNNACIGARYIATYRLHNTTFHVAAILCAPTRYKLLITESSDSTGRYRDIGDSSGNGTDHCEVVGTDMEYSSAIKSGSSEKGNSKLGVGYHRNGWGQLFRRTKIAVDDIPGWYECGISIPSGKKMYGCTSKEETGLSTGGTIGIIIACLLIIGCLIYLIVRVTHVQTKLCPRREDGPPRQSLPAQLPPAEPVQSDISHSVQDVAHPEASELSQESVPQRVVPTAPPQRIWEEGAPPSYEEAQNYPLVRAAKASPPPYKYHSP